MNIHIYYQAKLIALHLQNQSSQNQAFKQLDILGSRELKQVFENFIQQNDHDTLQLETADFDTAIEKIKRAFYYIEAAGGLIEKDGKYLFIRRFDKWDLPKGKLDPGETPEQAAVRECHEECGIEELIIQRCITALYHMYEYKDGYAFKKTWWYSMSSTDTKALVPQVEEHIDRVEWFDQEDISRTVLPNTYPSIKEILRQTYLL